MDNILLSKYWSGIKDTPKAFDDFTNKQQSCMKVMFFDKQKYKYSQSSFNTPYNKIKRKC